MIKKLLPILAIIAAQASFGVTLVDDIVDADEGWSDVPAAGTGDFSTSVGGLSPVEGTSFYYADASVTGTGNRGIYKYFDGVTFATTTESYTITVSYSIGDLTTADFSTGNGYLMADVNNDGIYEWGERILPTTKDRSTPADGEWIVWTDTYEITSTTTTADGDLIAGSTLGFFYISTLAEGSAYALDALGVESSIPEPSSSYFLLPGLGMLGALLYRKFRR